MKLLLPKFLTCLFIAIVVTVGAVKAFTSLAFESDENRTTVEFEKCGITRLQEQLNPFNEKFILAVVGDGVNDPTPSKARPYSSNYAQGWDLYEGVEQAKKQPAFDAISKFVEIIYIDDGGDSRCAQLISQEIVKSARVIGVIGHATTGTTRVALLNYKKANIPTIIPIATNPFLTVGCKNCFRLPSNDRTQAKVIADYAVNQLHGQRIYLVWDGSDSAREYSEFLQSEIVNLIGSKLKFRQPITFRPMNYDYLLKSISYNDTDVLIFCGYGSLAREFLNGLSSEYDREECANANKKEGKPTPQKPKVILSDGSRIFGITDVATKFKFEAYLSFPSDKYSTKPQQFFGFKPQAPPHEPESLKDQTSCEIFGYDALALFSLAFKRMAATGYISRDSLNRALAENNGAGGDLCYTYNFQNGENVDEKYFVYSLATDTVVQPYDSNILNNAFIEKPLAEKIGTYASIALLDRTARDRLAETMKADSNATVQIIVSRNDESSNLQSKRFLQALVSENKIDSKRFDFGFGVGSKEEAEIWVIPSGSSPPAHSGTYTWVNGEKLLSQTSSTSSERK